MKVYEIAKAKGVSSKDVAEKFGIEKTAGYVMKVVADDEAQAYIGVVEASVPPPEAEVIAPPPAVDEPPEQEAVPEVAKPRPAKFWSTSRKYLVLGDGERSDIRFADWSYECEEGSPECEFMRHGKNGRGGRDYFIAQHTYEVLPYRHEESMKVADFRDAMKACIYTGLTGDPTPSREGRNSIKALLPVDIAERLGTSITNAPRILMGAIADNVSLNVDEYSETL